MSLEGFGMACVVFFFDLLVNEWLSKVGSRWCSTSTSDYEQWGSRQQPERGAPWQLPRKFVYICLVMLRHVLLYMSLLGIFARLSIKVKLGHIDVWLMWINDKWLCYARCWWDMCVDGQRRGSWCLGWAGRRACPSRLHRISDIVYSWKSRYLVAFPEGLIQQRYFVGAVVVDGLRDAQWVR